jgi:hypothetical protein
MILKNKKGFTSTGFYIGMLLLSGVIIFGVISSQSLASEYNNEDILDENFEEKYSRLTEYSEVINQSLQSAKEETGLVNVVQTIFKSSFAFIEFLLSSLGILSDPAASFTEDFNIPTQVAGAFFTILLGAITIVIVVRVISALTQRKI